MKEVKKDLSINEMYEDLKKMRIERKIDRILDSLSEYSALIKGGPGSGAGSGVIGAANNRKKSAGSGAGTGVKGAKLPSRTGFGRIRSEHFDDDYNEDHESYIVDNPPDEGKQSLSVSSRPYDHPLKAGSNLSIEQGFAFMKDEFTNDEGISDIPERYEEDDEDDDWQDSEYDDGPAEENNDQKLDNEINHVPNQNAEELYDDIKDEMLGEMVDKKLNEDVYTNVSNARAKHPECEKYWYKNPKQWKPCLDGKLSEGLSGPGGKFGFEGEEGYKGKMGEDSNESEEKINEEITGAHVAGVAAGIAGAGLVAWHLHRSGLKDCENRFKNDKHNYDRCVKHVKSCGHIRDDEEYKKCMKKP